MGVVISEFAIRDSIAEKHISLLNAGFPITRYTPPIPRQMSRLWRTENRRGQSSNAYHSCIGRRDEERRARRCCSFG